MFISAHSVMSPVSAWYIQLCLEHGKRGNVDYEELMQFAISNGNGFCLKHLLEKGARYSMDTLLRACSFGDALTVQTLFGFDQENARRLGIDQRNEEALTLLMAATMNTLCGGTGPRAYRGTLSPRTATVNTRIYASSSPDI